MLPKNGKYSQETLQVRLPTIPNYSRLIRIYLLTSVLFLLWSLLLIYRPGQFGHQLCKFDHLTKSEQDFWNSYCQCHSYDSGFNPLYSNLQIAPGVASRLPDEKPRKLSYYYLIGEIFLLTSFFILPTFFPF